MRKSHRELLKEYDKIRTEMRSILEKAAAEGRALWESEGEGRINERAVFDELEEKAKSLRAQMEQEQQLRALELELPGEFGSQAPPPAAAGNPGGERADVTTEQRQAKHSEAFRRYISSGDPHAYRRAAAELGASQRDGGQASPELRGLQAESDLGGGFITAPVQWSNQLIEDMNKTVVMRRISKVVPVTGGASGLGYPRVTTKRSGAVNGSEIGSIPVMTDAQFGAREWKPAPITGYTLISRTLLRRGVFPVDAYVRSEIARVFGEKEEDDYLTGDGANGVSLGVFTASDQGISTARDFSTHNSTSQIHPNGLKQCKHNIKRGYWPFLRWVFHQDAVAQIDMLRYDDGRWMWDESVKNPEDSPRLLGFPVEIADYAPNTFTTGQYVGILGAFNPCYLIAVEVDVEISQLNELFALTNQIAFIGREWVDGMPQLEEAFARVKLG